MTSITIYTPFLPDQYCVYHTTYSGKLLPENYIGSTYVDRILLQNYHGSVASKRYKAIWESEINLHPELFSTVIVSYHDTRPNATWKELQVQKIFNVVKSDLFINRSYASEGYGDTTYTPEERASSTKKRLDTISNKSPEEKSTTGKNISDGWANKSPEEKAATIQNRVDSYIISYANKSPEEKAATEQKRADTRANRTPEQKAATKQKNADTYANRTPEQKAAAKWSDNKKGKTRTPFLSMIHNQKTYGKANISRNFPEFKQYF